MDHRMHRAVTAALHNCLAVQPGELVAILAAESGEWASALFLVGVEEADAVPIADAASARVIICLTPAVPDAALTAVRQGARLAHMPDLKPETLARALLSDYKATAVRARHLASLLEAASEARVVGSELDLTIPLTGRAAADTGILRAPGSCGQLPGGEARRGRLSLGCNDKAVVWGDPLEDRKARGSVTVDGVHVRNGTLLLDGLPLVERGVLLGM